MVDFVGFRLTGCRVVDFWLFGYCWRLAFLLICVLRIVLIWCFAWVVWCLLLVVSGCGFWFCCEYCVWGVLWLWRVVVLCFY